MTGALDLPRLPIVLGAGRSGLAAATALAEAGREVTLVDDDPAGVSGAPVPVVGPEEVEYEGCEAIIRSPGVAKERDRRVHEHRHARPATVDSDRLYGAHLHAGDGDCVVDREPERRVEQQHVGPAARTRAATVGAPGAGQRSV